ncbi:MAG: Peptidase family M9 N-terminal [Marinobacter excellens HL-55]|uniref:Peptidase family M9 N-terminal n=1 Tax=Marinobacter excellens HL-55 TaxID=1305731 RepID=A0A0P7ZE68_9GAMM|nr:MAG: Peptidase family M9 N-terminal [Marinobacter excellens HL-55]
MPVQPTRILSPLSLLIPAVILTCLLISPKAFAQNLTEANVRAFLDSLQAAEPVMMEHEEELEALTDQSDDTDFSAIFSSGLEKMKGHAMYQDLERVAKRHGFSSIKQWAKTGDQIFQAWIALEMDEQRPSQQEMQQALAEIESSPHMTPEQKEQMKAMMGSAMTTMNQASDVPNDNKRAVRPFMDELRAMSEDEDSGW